MKNSMHTVARSLAAVLLLAGASQAQAAPVPDAPDEILTAAKQGPYAKIGPFLGNLYDEYRDAAGKGVNSKSFKSSDPYDARRGRHGGDRPLRLERGGADEFVALARRDPRRQPRSARLGTRPGGGARRDRRAAEPALCEAGAGRDAGAAGDRHLAGRRHASRARRPA